MKTPLRLKAALAITFAVCCITAFVFADSKQMKFGGGSDTPQMIIDTNLFIKAGNSSSNAAVAATIWTGYSAIANPTSNGTAAAIYSLTIPSGSVFVQNGDTLFFEAAGTMPTAQANTNQFTLVFGATTILDTGLQTVSNGTYHVSATIVRTGDTSGYVRARCEWGVAGAPFATTNAVLSISETNTVDTVLSFNSTARRQGSHTNLFAQLAWKPTGK
jgi:hypothetical protein